MIASDNESQTHSRHEPASAGRAWLRGRQVNQFMPLSFEVHKSLAIVDLGDMAQNRAHLQELTKYVDALTGAIAGAKKAGQNQIAQVNGLPAWENLEAALKTAQAALGLMVTGSIR